MKVSRNNLWFQNGIPYVYDFVVTKLRVNENETLGEKAKWKLHKNAACCFERILEAAPYKTAVVRPFISHLANYPQKTRKTCLPVLGK